MGFFLAAAAYRALYRALDRQRWSMADSGGFLWQAHEAVGEAAPAWPPLKAAQNGSVTGMSWQAAYERGYLF